MSTNHKGGNIQPTIDLEEHQGNLNAKRIVTIDEGGGVAGDGAVRKKLIDTTTTANVTYIGEAALGTATSAASWRIKKINETSSPTTITWTGLAFDSIWDNRASLTYT